MEIASEIYKKLFEKAPIGLALNGMDGVFIEINRTLLEMTGYTQEEFLNLTYWDITPIEYEPLEKVQIELMAKTGRYGPYEKEYIHKKGHRFPVLLNGVVVDDGEGNQFIWSTVENISDVKNAEKLLQKAQEMANIGHWNLDLQKNELYWSDETYRIFGLRPQEFAATYDAFVERIHPDDRDAVNNAYGKSLEDKQPYEIDHRVMRPDGSIRHVHERCEHRYDKDGNIIGSIGTVLDVTQQHETERELIAAKEKAESANRAKSIFIANMSHELRTPMNAILGFSKMMTRAENLSAEQQNSLEVINRSGEHLLAMINEILDMSKIESGEMQVKLEAFELTSLFDEIASLMQMKAKEKGLLCNLTIDENVPKYIKNDKNKLRQVLINIVGNAIKFTHEGGIAIRVHAGRKEQSMHAELLIEVEDSGSGIDASMHEDIFKPFFQNGSGEMAEGGTGLGLVISRKLVALLGGTITLQSSLGHGSIFSIALPVEISASQNVADSDKNTRIVALQKPEEVKKILVVDDTATNRILCSSLLSKVGFEVKGVSSGEEAVEAFVQWQPDLILMDMRMNGMNGYEATEKIRELPQGDKVKIIILSAHVIQEEHDADTRDRSDGFIGKPFDEEELLMRIGGLLNVAYFHEEMKSPDKAALANRFDPASLDALEDTARSEIYEAAVQGNGKRLKNAIGTIEAAHPALAAHLKTLSAKYDFDAIVALLEG